MKHTCPEHGRNRPRTGSDQPLCPCGSMNGVYHEDDCPKKRGETMPSDRLEKKPEADVALAGAALEKAIALAEEGWSYASEYFREKWGCVEELKALRRIASVTDDEPLPTSWAEEVLERAAPCASVGESNAGKVGRPEKRAVNSGDAGHEWAQHEREGWTVCSRCGLVRNYDRESPCRRVMPEIEPRDGGAS